MKMGLNWLIPALMNNRVGSLCGTTGLECMCVWPHFSMKKSTKAFLTLSVELQYLVIVLVILLEARILFLKSNIFQKLAWDGERIFSSTFLYERLALGNLPLTAHNAPSRRYPSTGGLLCDNLIVYVSCKVSLSVSVSCTPLWTSISYLICYS